MTVLKVGVDINRKRLTNWTRIIGRLFQTDNSLTIFASGAMSDSHPETLTDPEHSDHAGVASSPPQSGDEVRGRERPGKESERRSKLFNKTPGGHQVLERFNQTIKTRHSLAGDKKDNSFKVGTSRHLTCSPQNGAILRFEVWRKLFSEILTCQS